MKKRKERLRLTNPMLVLALVLMLFVGVMPGYANATEYQENESYNDTTASTYESASSGVEEQDGRTWSLLSLLEGDATKFIENEMIIFGGEAGRINSIALIAVYAVFAMIGLGILCWGLGCFTRGAADIIVNILCIIVYALLFILYFGFELLKMGGDLLMAGIEYLRIAAAWIGKKNKECYICLMNWVNTTNLGAKIALYILIGLAVFTAFAGIILYKVIPEANQSIATVIYLVACGHAVFYAIKLAEEHKRQGTAGSAEKKQ